jgi:tetratricopeptide (TPR) repeat protein
VKLPGEIPHRKVSQDDPLFKKTQAEMEKNIQLATFLTAHYHFSAAEELFLLTLHDAEGALGEPQSRPSLDLDTEVNLDPDINVDAASYVNFLLRRLGNVFHNQRKLPEAVKRYRRALDEHNVGEIDPSFLYETQNNLGIVYMEMHNMDEAEKMHNMDEAEKFASFAAESRGMLVKEAEEKLAAEEKKKNSVKEAEEKLERAKVVWVRSINNLAAIHQYQGRLDDARHGYNKALDVVTTSPRPWRFGLEELQTRINLGRLYMKEGEGRSGEDGYEGARKAIEAFYEAIGAWERKAQAEWEEKANAEGDKVMGDVELTQQQLTHPSGLLAFECMAKAYSRLEKWDEAQEKFGQAFAGHLSARHIQICDTAKSWATFLVNRNRPGPARWALSTAKDVLMANYSTYEQGLKELDDLRREIDRIIEPEILCWCDGKIEAAIEHEILHQLSGETNARVKKDPLNMSGNNTQQQIRHGFWDGIGDGIKQQVERKIEDKLDDGIKQHTRTQSPDKFTDETKQKMKQNILDKIAEDLEGQVEWKVSPDKLADGSN